MVALVALVGQPRLVNDLWMLIWLTICVCYWSETGWGMGMQKKWNLYPHDTTGTRLKFNPQGYGNSDFRGRITQPLNRTYAPCFVKLMASLTWSNFRLALSLRKFHWSDDQRGQDYRRAHGRLHGDTPRSFGQVSHLSIMSLHFLSDILTRLSLETSRKGLIMITVSHLKWLILEDSLVLTELVPYKTYCLYRRKARNC